MDPPIRDGASSLLYELVLHGHGWRYDQQQLGSAGDAGGGVALLASVGEAGGADGWVTTRELAAGEDLPPAAAPISLASPGGGGPADAAAAAAAPGSRRLEAAAAQQWARAAVESARESPAVSLALALAQQALAWPAESAPPSLPRWAAFERTLPFPHEALLRQLPRWRIALAPAGELLALWQSRQLLLLSARDGFTAPVGVWRCASSDGAEGQPRRVLAWDRDGSLLAAATADGTVHVFDARLRLLHSLPYAWWGAAPKDGAPAHPPPPGEAGADEAAAAAASALGSDVSYGELLTPPPPASPPLLGLAWREAAGARGVSSQLLLLSAGGKLHRVTVPLAATVAVHGAKPQRCAAPPLSMFPAHGFVTSLAYCTLGGEDEPSGRGGRGGGGGGGGAAGGGGAGAVGLLAVGGGGCAPSKAAALVLAKAAAADESRGSASDAPTPSLPSLSLWAISDEAPYARLLFSTTAAASPSSPLLAPLRALARARAVATGNGVPHCLAFSPNGSHLAALTLTGQLSVWPLASLHAAAKAPAGAVAAAGVAQRTPEPPRLYTGGATGSEEQWVSVSWWGKGALVLAKRSGSVSVAALPRLSEMLGERPESFARLPLLSEPRGSPTTFFVLTREEAEAAPIPPGGNSRPGSPAGRPVPQGGPVAGSEGREVAAARRRVESWWLYSLRRTTPEAMFERKVGLKEYGDALTYANSRASSSYQHICIYTCIYIYIYIYIY